MDLLSYYQVAAPRVGGFSLERSPSFSCLSLSEGSDVEGGGLFFGSSDMMCEW
jgi:hypothetical protein